MFIYKYCIYNELDDSNVFGCVYGLYQGGCDTLPMVLSNEECQAIQFRELESQEKSCDKVDMLLDEHAIQSSISVTTRSNHY